MHAHISESNTILAAVEIPNTFSRGLDGKSVMCVYHSTSHDEASRNSAVGYSFVALNLIASGAG